MSIVGVIVIRLVEYFRRRVVVYAAVVALYTLGVVAGAAAVGAVQGENHLVLAEYVHGYVAQLGTSVDEAIPDTASTTIAGEVLRSAALPWLLGLTVLGAVGAMALLFLKGFALGFTFAFLVKELSFRGLLLGFVGVLPQSLFAVPALILATGAAVTFALSAAKVLTGHRREGGIGTQFVSMTLLAAVAAILIACSVWVETNLSPILLHTIAAYIQVP